MSRGLDCPAVESRYETPGPERPGMVARNLPSLAYYPRMLRIVYEASKRSLKDEYGDEAWCQGCWQMIRLIERLGGCVIAEGVEHVRGLDRPCVFIGNHMSTLETFVLPAFILPYRRVTFVVKKSLVEYPVFKHVMRTREPVVVTREDPKADFRAVMEAGQERLGRGYCMVVFPQHTRQVRFEPEQFNTIGVKLARRAKAPVVPLALKTNAWENGRLIKDFGPFRPGRPVRFAFGEPMEVTGTGHKEHGEVISFIQGKLAGWREEDGPAG